jgi:hypothetical protein
MKAILLFLLMIIAIPKAIFGQQIIGEWEGVMVTNDPSTGEKSSFWVKINFEDKSAFSNVCGEGKNRGKVKFVSESVVEIDWPNCGLETISIDINGNKISAVGSNRAFSGGRVIPTKWELTKKLINNVWIGDLITNDVSVGKKQSFNLKIDFTNKSATSDGYGNGKIIGRIKILNSNLLEIDWPNCGLETVSFEINGTNLKAFGSNRAYSGGRTIPVEWQLRKSN